MIKRVGFSCFGDRPSRKSRGSISRVIPRSSRFDIHPLPNPAAPRWQVRMRLDYLFRIDGRSPGRIYRFVPVPEK